MSQTTEKKWRAVMLPTPLVDELEKMANKKGSGFTGISDCATYILRKHIEGGQTP
jgi:hypothetical protein